MDKKYVTTGKPATGGAMFHAPIGSTIPTDAVSDLSSDYKDLGYCSEDGLAASGEITTQDIKEWGGQIVDSSEVEKKDIYTVTFIESMNPEVLKVVHSSENVSGDLDTGITVTANAKEHDYEIYVCDMILKDAIERIVLPYAKVISVSEVNYKKGEAVGYQCKIAAYPDESGNTHYEYIIAVGAQGTTGATGATGATGVE